MDENSIEFGSLRKRLVLLCKIFSTEMVHWKQWRKSNRKQSRHSNVHMLSFCIAMKQFLSLFRNLQDQGASSFKTMVSISSNCTVRRKNYCRSTLLSNVFLSSPFRHFKLSVKKGLEILCSFQHVLKNYCAVSEVVYIICLYPNDNM